MTEGVIVVDNDVLIRGILRSMLAGVGLDVFAAASGWEALGFASRMQARLVLLDLDMPGLNGLLTCKKLRDLPGYDSTPIVILSAHDGEDAHRAAERVGATLFLAKPFQPAALLLALSAYLQIDVSTKEAMARAAQQARQITAADAERDRVRGSQRNRL